MQKVLISTCILALSAVLPFSTLSAQATELKQVSIESAYQGSSSDLRKLNSDFDWKAYNKKLAAQPDRVVPNQTRFSLKGENISGSQSPAVPDALIKGPSGTRVDLRRSFDGTSDEDNETVVGGRIVPPDTNGDVGKNYYIQSNNLVFDIFSKKNGKSALSSPLPNNIFFTGTGTFCEQWNDGDPNVLYDHDAERWIFTQFAIYEFVPNLGVFVSHQCFAVSQTSDPLGAYYVYDFVYSVPFAGGFAALNDYPKVTVWPDAYYISVNEFEVPIGFVGASLGAFDRAAMLAGAPAKAVKFILPFTGVAPAFFSLQPSHWEASNHAPPAGAPNIFVQAFDDETWGFENGDDGYWHWAMSVDFDADVYSLTDLGLIPTEPFDAILCGFSACIPQPAPATVADDLDTLSQFTMYRASYQNFRQGHQSIVVSHSVDVDGLDTAGVRWAELRDSGDGYVLHQSGTHAPDDGDSRWMGAASMNQSGDIAIGFNVSSTGTFPSIRVAGRRKNDPLGTMGMETECHAGTGSQIGSFNRWGDYSSMSVDPKDKTTFWFTGEYYETSGAFDFNTRICAFKLTSSNASGKR